MIVGFGEGMMSRDEAAALLDLPALSGGVAVHDAVYDALFPRYTTALTRGLSS